METANFLSKTLTDEQKVAIEGSLNNWISVITGGSGTGKTTIIAELVHNLEMRDVCYSLNSFTGKAVARIREVVKRRNPATLHRMIARAGSAHRYAHIIIDECSMVTEEVDLLSLQSFPLPIPFDPHR